MTVGTFGLVSREDDAMVAKEAGHLALVDDGKG